jgi:HPt (histidine-containing phosphotransfer) domain-containing protein
MALKIKEGVEIFPYGFGNGSFNDKSELSQEILQHLKQRFPEEIEEIETKTKQSKNKQ